MKTKILIKLCSLFLVSLFIIVSLGGCNSPATTSTATKTSAQTVSTTVVNTTPTTQAALPASTSTTIPVVSSTSTSTTTASSTTTTTSLPNNSTPTSSTSSSTTTSTATTTTTRESSGGGGGGGSSAHYLEVSLLDTSSKTRVSSGGKLSKEFSLSSGDGSVKLVIPAGTVALNGEGKRLSDITVTTDSNTTTAPDGTRIITPVYKFEPNNATFSPAITLTVAYNLESYQDIAEDLLYFAAYDEVNKVWDELTDETTLNSTNKTVSTSLGHFSTYTVLGHTTREITDMYGYTQQIPAVINKVLSCGPVETQLIYMLAPEKLAAVNGIVAGIGGWATTDSYWNESWDGTAPYIPDEYLDEALGGPLPDIGNGSGGDSAKINYETINSIPLDIVIEGKTKNLNIYRSNINVPVVGVNAGNSLCWDFKGEIEFVGNLLGVPDKAQELIEYYEDALDYVNNAVEDIRPASINDEDNLTQVRVLYAQGTDGYSTDAKGSWHTNLLWFCGGSNVADVEVTSGSNAVPISGEQILAWEDEDPIDMIIIGRTSQASTYNTIKNDEVYKTLSCVKLGKMYVRPDNPTSWFDGPPGYGQIVGMYWMVRLLYPDRTIDLNLDEQVKEFYSKFMHYNLTTAQVNQLLKQPGE